MYLRDKIEDEKSDNYYTSTIAYIIIIYTGLVYDYTNRPSIKYKVQLYY